MTGLLPLLVPYLKTIQTITSFLLVIDIILTFFTAYKKELRIEVEKEEKLSQKELLKKALGKKVADELSRQELLEGDQPSDFVPNTQKSRAKGAKFAGKPDDDVWEKRFSEIAKKYLKSTFFFEFMACVPILIYELMYGFSTDYETVTKMLTSGWY